MSSALLQTHALGVSFGGVQAVRSVDFNLEEGELRCLIGPNGAGKSTFFKLISGQLRPTRGDVYFRGQPIAGLTTHHIARLGIGIKPQTPSVFDGLDVLENLRLAATCREGRHSARQLAIEVLGRIDLENHAHRLVGDLSHGQRQWVELGMILASRPRLVLLDEPAAGMTQAETNITAALIRDINAEASVIVVEHDMDFIRRIANTITVFHQGGILAEGSFEQVTQDAQVRDAYLGREVVNA
ncbi:ATP-binding cassette domain-containing protein [Vreelandella janggokensis]|uniref:ATP-binding cassette domain-containing protein n=1 Tax=Vreelandella janggokensis TaxID=370767 RepID=UPI0028546495|nr:ATP-binding cassette domain-containing protein [Halomonas janggokensis]MDR5886430.1 ATP-binding cassette domain-containing protein [Halomonas janggokensis]